MTLDQTKQEILDHLNLGEAGKDALKGAATGATAGAIVGGAVGQVFPPIAPIASAAGALYGTVIGGAIGFLDGLFTTDPEVTRRKARELYLQRVDANRQLNHMFATYPPNVMALLTKPPFDTGYRSLIVMANQPATYTDPLIYIDNPTVREVLREKVRLATVSSEHPIGIVLGDREIKDEVTRRLEARKSFIEKGFAEAKATLSKPGRGLAVGVGASVIAVGVTIAAWWKRRKLSRIER